jgi:methionine-rich copper-binding protein CopC
MKHVIAWLALSVAGTAWAHAHLQTSTPAEGSVLDGPPATFAMKFNEPATLTLLTLQKDSEAPQKIAAPDKPAVDVNVPAPKLSAGSYTLSFKALSADNHVVSGQIHFKVTR